MGFLDFLTGGQNCPKCGTPGAKKDGGRYRCLNPTCEYFEASFMQGFFGGSGNAVTPEANSPQNKAGSGWGSAPTSAGAMVIHYRNFRGQQLTFNADPSSVVQKKNHISIKALPTGQRVSLSRSRIQNLADLEAVVPPRVAPGQEWPTARERQVLSYHKKYGTTSPLYEKIRAKYPNW